MHASVTAKQNSTYRPIEGGADIVFAKVAEQLHRQCHIKHELVGPGHKRIAQKTGAVQHIAQQHDKEQRHGAVHAEQKIFQHGSHPAVAALLCRQLLLQGSFAVVQQQVFVVLEVALAAVLGEEGVGTPGSPSAR